VLLAAGKAMFVQGRRLRRFAITLISQETRVPVRGLAGTFVGPLRFSVEQLFTQSLPAVP
jgi:hypothetical protein